MGESQLAHATRDGCAPSVVGMGSMGRVLHIEHLSEVSAPISHAYERERRTTEG